MHAVLLLLLGAVGADPAAPRDLRCQWRPSPAVVKARCPEFFWQIDSQSALELTVAESQAGFERPVWRYEARGSLPIVEYAGPPLVAGKPYWWRVRVWDAGGRKLPDPPVQQFTVEPKPMPHYLPSIRTFVNFAGDPEWAKDKIDLCFRKDAKRGRSDILATQYSLIATMVVPSKKADDLAAFCRQHGYELEDCFCHYAEDTPVTLHLGAEKADRPLVTRVLGGWDPRNDRNADGRLDDAERASRANPRATGVDRRQARVPIYYWGPPADDFVMNVGHPGYRRFMAEVYVPAMAEGYDGIYFDTLSPRPPAARGPLVEYPPDHIQRWLADLQLMLAQIKIRLPEKIVTGNGWHARPMVIDGYQDEGWLNVAFAPAAGNEPSTTPRPPSAAAKCNGSSTTRSTTRCWPNSAPRPT